MEIFYTLTLLCPLSWTVWSTKSKHDGLKQRSQMEMLALNLTVNLLTWKIRLRCS